MTTTHIYTQLNYYNTYDTNRSFAQLSAQSHWMLRESDTAISVFLFVVFVVCVRNNEKAVLFSSILCHFFFVGLRFERWTAMAIELRRRHKLISLEKRFKIFQQWTRCAMNSHQTQTQQQQQQQLQKGDEKRVKWYSVKLAAEFFFRSYFFQRFSIKLADIYYITTTNANGKQSVAHKSQFRHMMQTHRSTVSRRHCVVQYLLFVSVQFFASPFRCLPRASKLTVNEMRTKQKMKTKYNTTRTTRFSFT